MTARPADGDVVHLVEKLKAVRAAHSEDSTEALKEALRQTVRDAVGELSRDEAGRRLDKVRDQLISEARQRDERAERLEVEARQARSEIESLKADRNRLAAENARLKTLADKPVPVTREAAGGTDVLDRIREGLRRMAKDDVATPESLGLPASEARFFRLTQELLGFALRVEFGVEGLLSDVGAVTGRDTQIRKALGRLIRDRFRACLDNETGSIKALQERLNRNSRFLLDLNSAYVGAIKQGIPAVLNEIDPQPILDKNAGRFGMTNFEGAWREFSSRQNDLAGMTFEDMWERFFVKAFQEKLGQGL